MNVADLDRCWSNLQPPEPPAELTGIRMSGLPAHPPVYVARDATGHRHLLVSVPQDIEPVKQRPTRGLDVTTELLTVSRQPQAMYINFACLDPIHDHTFAVVAHDIVEALSSATAPNLRTVVLNTIERWRAFWSVDQAGLTREEALGLFGELWFIDRWLRSAGNRLLDCWHGPDGARHDFQWDAASVEVKATAHVGATVIHRITGLDQLDAPLQGQLYLFSLHLVDDALASNTLPALVERITASFSHDAHASRLLSEKLAAYGYSPAHVDRYQRPLRIVSEELFVVERDFPRLTRSRFPGGIPPGVDGITYLLSIAACARWRIASAPGDPGAHFLRMLSGQQPA